ncbi:MAG TPA: DNA-protecting protein DprA [Chloroflexi bacterium]|nr:DNA-protecting protein DprA [Chloroflexota bacterium]
MSDTLNDDAREAKELTPWLGFQRVPGIGPARLGRLVELFGSVASAWAAPTDDLRAVGVSDEMIRAIDRVRNTLDIEAELGRMRRAGVRAIPLNSDEYPRLLRHVTSSPPLLFTRGQLAPEDDVAVAIVGTRRSSSYGIHMTTMLASGLAAAGVTIVSGLAHGVDTAAHRAALEAGGRTVAVFGSGPDVIYPAQNKDLARRIIQSGAVVSEHPVGVKPDARNFPARNRIISGMSRGVLVVEAPTQSGAMLTASFAADQGRDVFAVPGQATSDKSAGCHALIRNGATLVTNVEQILEQLDLASAKTQRQTRMVLPETPNQRTLYAVLSAEPQHVDDICHTSALPIHEVSGTLLEMELKGLIRQTAPQHYVRA